MHSVVSAFQSLSILLTALSCKVRSSLSINS
eukprot:UN27347